MERTPRLWALRALSGGLVLAALLAPGCSSSSSGSTPCNEAPWQCGAGSTCWPDCVCPSGQTCTMANCTMQFACVGSKSGVLAGENCSLDNGAAQCGDDQTCVAFKDAGAGSCRTYCDQNLQCGPDFTCTLLTVGGKASATEHVCLPPQIGLDGGLMIDTGASSSSSGGDAASDAVVIQDAGGPLMDGRTGNM
jgi:hypothetical protein